MKFLIAFVAIVAVASAEVKPTVNVNSELSQIVAAIQSPNTDPATALLLEQQLFELLGLLPEPEPIAVGPVIVEEDSPISVGPAIVEELTPIAVGPEIIDFPVPDGGAVTAVVPSPVAPAPVVVGPAETAASPLVQIILNINANQPGAVAVLPEPVIVPEVVAHPDPVHVVEVAHDNNPAPIEIAPTPVQVVEVAEVPEPVVVVDAIPVAPEPIQVAEPILPAPAVVLPDILN